MINLTIDGFNVSVPEGTTILEAARCAGIDIPTLCFLKDINEAGDCRMCIVEVEGRRGFATSCIQKVEEGMVVKTNSKDVSEAREALGKTGKTSSQAIGHKELQPYIEGKISLDEAVENLKRETRRYAKRQLTWFRKNKNVRWVYTDGENDFPEVEAISLAKEFLKD